MTANASDPLLMRIEARRKIVALRLVRMMHTGQWRKNRRLFRKITNEGMRLFFKQWDRSRKLFGKSPLEVWIAEQIQK